MANEELAVKLHPTGCITGGTTMQTQDRLKRLQLIGRVQLAYEQLKDTMQRYHDDSPRARAAIAAAKKRLSLLNRALAMLALEAAQSSPA
ncbi:MAG: hypothetical protein E6J78_04540 [Deltaproteobacteria bacterium]|nr:MAG: hypothetical protein E6J78_04540 [Deltaproteobacteria bacterium]